METHHYGSYGYGCIPHHELLSKIYHGCLTELNLTSNLT